MLKNKFERLLKKGILTEKELNEKISEAVASGEYPEEWLIKKGVPKHEILFSLTEFYSCSFVEYDESVIASFFLTRRLSMEKLKRNLWFPLAVNKGRAEVIAYHPFDPDVIKDVKDTLGVRDIDFVVALPSDLVRIIEHNFDVNPRFPASAGRTPLAKVRTFLADRRSLMACNRTSLGKGRTGLAFIRTGISFLTIAVVLFRIFGIGLLSVFESVLFISGIIMTVDGLLWYLPARKTGKKVFECRATEPTWGTTVLEVVNPGDNPLFVRTGHVEDAAVLRSNWSNLSPVMRRRFLASDRTDFAEERTTHVCYWTSMARARTGLAFTRTGVVFIGFGIGLLRQFTPGPWTFFDASLIVVGVAMATEGFYWYMPGRHAGWASLEAVRKTQAKKNIWDFIFPPALKHPGSDYKCVPPVKPSHAPGIWATTGLALERTMLADRRNVMMRLRTVMTRSRTGLALVRTGVGISAVGTELLVFFGTGNTAWTIFNASLIVIGLALVVDGFCWHIPAEKIRKQYPYCYGDMEIAVPDYGKPVRSWKKVMFSTDEGG
ncbi:MAG: hypothetical protein HQL09_00655 [Nitrospirae bacterium]|nr:hypothetical protein [Nitrospirota bacterium]